MHFTLANRGIALSMPTRYVFEGKHCDLFRFSHRRWHIFLTRLCDTMYQYFWHSNLTLNKSNSKRKKYFLNSGQPAIFFQKKCQSATYFSLCIYIYIERGGRNKERCGRFLIKKYSAMPTFYGITFFF